MAYIRAHSTAMKRKGKTVKRYEVVWREPATDPTTGLPTGKMRARQESYPTREAAEARRDELNNAKHQIGGTSALADAKKAGELPFAHYAEGFIARQRSKVAAGKLKARTCERYDGTIRHHLLKRFGARAVGAITVTDCERFRADLLANRRPRTVRNVWQMLDRVLEYAYEHKAISAVPTDVIDRSAMHYAVGDDAGFAAHPLTAAQVAALAAKVGERYEVYGLLVLFMAYTGLRAAEVQGLEVRDLVLTTSNDGTVKGSVRVQRTKSRRKREWVIGTPKSKTSKRTVPLPPWLATAPCRLPAKCPPLRQRADRSPVAATAPRQPRRQAGPRLVGPAGPQRPTEQDRPPRLGSHRAPRQPASEHSRRRHPHTRHERCSAARPSAHGGSPVAYCRGPLYPGGEVAWAQQLRVDPDHLRRLHPRRRDREPAARTCYRRAKDERRATTPRAGRLAALPRNLTGCVGTRRGASADSDQMGWAANHSSSRSATASGCSSSIQCEPCRVSKRYSPLT